MCLIGGEPRCKIWIVTDGEHEEIVKDLLYKKHKASQHLGGLSAKCRALHHYIPGLLETLSSLPLRKVALSQSRSNLDNLINHAGDLDVIGVIREAVETAEEIEKLKDDLNATNGIVE